MASGALTRCPPGLVIGALRANFRHGNPKVVGALAKHVSETVNRHLRRMIGTDHPNRGLDIIERAAATLLEAIFDPTSTDGDELVVAFSARLRYRALDAARAEGRYQARIVDLGSDEDGEIGRAHGSDVLAREANDVGHLLARIPDARHRLAFRLHMEGMRTHRGDPCVASVLGCHPRTAARWIASARRILENELGR